eukprot:6964364-Prymnesium_polylepis.1
MIANVFCDSDESLPPRDVRQVAGVAGGDALTAPALEVGGGARYCWSAPLTAALAGIAATPEQRGGAARSSAPALR